MKGIIFDFDGTLIDSMSVWRNLCTIYIESKGEKLTEEIAQKMTTNSLNMNAKILRDYYNFKGSDLDIYNEIGSTIKDYYENKFELKPNAIETLNILKDKGYKMCLGTATNEELLMPAIERFNLHKYFNFIQTVENVGISKSNKKFFQVAANKLSVQPGETYLFDDANHALKAAKEANIVTIAVYDESSHNMWEENKRISDYSILDLKDWLNKDII